MRRRNTAPPVYTVAVGSVGMTSAMDEALRALTATTGLTRAHHVREALAEYLARQGLMEPIELEPTTYRKEGK